MKNLLIIQLDSTYFLSELISALDIGYLKEQFTIHLFCQKESAAKVKIPSDIQVHFNTAEIISQKFDVSINVSLSETAWFIHEQVESSKKIGPHSDKENSLIVTDSWSSYLMTLKCAQPFLTFSLSQIYQNIIGLKAPPTTGATVKKVKSIVFDTLPPHLLSADQQEELITNIHQQLPHLKLLALEEWDENKYKPDETLFIGTPSLESYRLLSQGARGVLFSSVFSGFNLIPNLADIYLLVGTKTSFDIASICNIVKSQLKESTTQMGNVNFSIYKTNFNPDAGLKFDHISGNDLDFFLYETNVVLWNFLLGLVDVELKSSGLILKDTTLSDLRSNLSKLTRLQSYALHSLQTIYTESKKDESDTDLIIHHQHKLLEVDIHLDKVAQSNLYLRQILDYYRLKKSQDFGTNLTEKSQHQFLIYQEENEALKALFELIGTQEKKLEPTV